MAGKVCQICGTYSGIYPLCYNCFDLRDKEIVKKCDKCSKWYDTRKEHPCNEVKEQKECIVCSTITTNQEFCDECYKEINDHTNTIDKNRNLYEINDYYYNLRNYLWKKEGFEENIRSGLTKLYALANLNKNIHRNNSLNLRVYDDIKDLIEKKKITNLPKEIIEKKNEEIAGLIRTADGHFVDSDLERQVDDILYNLGKVHSYGKRVNDILERTVKCDWFIPVINNSKGIYIELWGMNNVKKYNINKEEKKKLYKDYNLPLIEIEQDELKGDTQGLIDRIEKEINQLSKEIYNKR